MKERILEFSEHNICLYCGKPIAGRYEDCDKYYECNCPDARKKRGIEAQIQKLKDSIPREKFSIEEKRVLYKIRN